MKNDLLAALLELVRARAGKRDVVRYALGSAGRAVRFIAILVAMALPPGRLVLLAEILARR